MKRMCPRAHPVTPHEMRQDAAGRWFCPIERDVELEQRDRDRQQTEQHDYRQETDRD